LIVQLDDNIRMTAGRGRVSRRRKLKGVSAETTSSGSPFQIRGSKTLKVRLPTVCTTRRLQGAGRAECSPTVQICYSVEWSKVYRGFDETIELLIAR